METGSDMPADQLLPAYLAIDDPRPAASLEGMIYAWRLAAVMAMLEPSTRPI